MSDDGRLALSTGDDDIVLWQLGTHGEVGAVHLPGFGYHARNLDAAAGRGAVLEAGGWVFGPVLVFDLESGKVTQLPRGTGSSVALSPDGRLVAFQEEPEPEWIGTVVVHDLETGRVARMQGMCPQSSHALPGAECAPFAEQPFAAFLYTMQFTTDGSRPVAHVVDGVDGVVVWDTATGEILRTEEPRQPYWEMALMPDSETLAIATDDHIEVGDLAGGPKEKHEVRSGILRFSADGSRLAAGAGFIAVSDTATWSEMRFVPIDAAPYFYDLTIAPGGSKVATGGVDGVVRVYDALSCELFQAIPIGGEITNVEFVNDEHILAVPRSGPGYIVTTDVAELLELAADRLTRTFASEECDTYRIDPCPAEPEAG
jgi:WD40 repeat protein